MKKGGKETRRALIIITYKVGVCLARGSIILRIAFCVRRPDCPV